ncbi:YczE/YyaS/YitT family protein [Anaerotignum sp.]
MSDTITFASDASKRSVKSWAVRLILLMVGLFIAHFGVVLFVLAEMGTDTFTIFVQGVSNVAGFSIGTCQVIILTVMMVLMAIFTKGYVKPGTLICAFCGGWQIDFYMWLLDGKLTSESALYIRVGAMVLGCVIIALGKAVVIMTDAGSGPNDLFSLIVSDAINKRKKIEFKWIRIVTDIMFTVVGVILGGVLGIGTLVTAFLTGPIVQVFLKPCQKMTNFFLAKAEGMTVEEMLEKEKMERAVKA